MSKEEILKTIRNLAQCQGLYSRLYARIMELSEDERDRFLQELEDKNFKDSVDLILFIEC